jgi:hypothetical protein
MILTESKVLWITGALVGAVVAPKGKRVLGGVLGAIAVGAIGDAAIDRIRARAALAQLPIVVVPDPPEKG